MILQTVLSHAHLAPAISDHIGTLFSHHFGEFMHGAKLLCKGVDNRAKILDNFQNALSPAAGESRFEHAMGIGANVILPTLEDTGVLSLPTGVSSLVSSGLEQTPHIFNAIQSWLPGHDIYGAEALSSELMNTKTPQGFFKYTGGTNMGI